MAVRHRGNGKRATLPEIGFIACQGIAGMLLLGILIQYIGARIQFKSGIEYLPVTITYTKSEERIETYREDGKERTRYRYDNSYYYVIDGVRYNGQMKDSYYSVVSGEQEIRYYNPEDPNELSYYQSVRDMMRDTKGAAIAVVIFEILAIVSKIISGKKKRLMKQKQKAYEDTIRQDMQMNRELYQSLDIRISREKLLSELEPLRKRINRNQKTLDKIKERRATNQGGIIVIDYLILRAIDPFRMPRLQNRLEEDKALFYREYKKHIAEPILQQFFEEFQYKPAQGFSPGEIEEFKLVIRGAIGGGKNVESEDYIEGVYQGIHYRQADVRKAKNAKNTELQELETGIQGRIAVYDFKKQLQGDVVITSKNNSIVNRANMEKVSVENLQFNEKFDIYAADAHTVFYLLTPQFMEYLLNLKLWGDTVFRFADQKIFVFRNHVGGIFEPNMERTLDIEYEIGKSYNELKEVLDFINVLKLEEMAIPTGDDIESERLQRTDTLGESVPQPKGNSTFRLKLE